MMKNPLPKAVNTKIYKTGQTRGADDDVIFQNRVNRNSTVLIPFREFELCRNHGDVDELFENGYIVLIKPEDYFDTNISESFAENNLRLGENMLVFYETRNQWNTFPPLADWTVPNSRTTPLGGQYVARVPATTAEDEGKVILGYNNSGLKGAGIRVYEYASARTINLCKLQMEYLFWQCSDVDQFIASSDKSDELRLRKTTIEREATELGLADISLLKRARILNRDCHTICPLCLKEISASGFDAKMQLAEGRDVPDLTVTEVSLFHIRELRTGEYNHRPYNLGWGHHHCNVVVKDSGIQETLQWMRDVIADNNAYDALEG